LRERNYWTFSNKENAVENWRSSAWGRAMTYVPEFFSAVVDAGYMIAIGTSARAPATIYLAAKYVDDPGILHQRGRLPCSDDRGTIGGSCRRAPHARDASCACDQHCEANDPHFCPPAKRTRSRFQLLRFWARVDHLCIPPQSHGTITVASRSSPSPGRRMPPQRSDFGRDHGAKMR
jgi:hypothetical protein